MARGDKAWTAAAGRDGSGGEASGPGKRKFAADDAGKFTPDNHASEAFTAIAERERDRRKALTRKIRGGVRRGG